jgi:DNA-binding FadR family transcriptional regulator
MKNNEKSGINLEAALRRDDDVKRRSWLLFNEVVGGGLSRRPRALELADDIEWLVSTSGVGPGERLGTERELARMFSVGPRVVRQASRSLIARGTIEPRRGNSGGFLVARTDETRALNAFAAALPAFEDRGAAAEALKQVGDTLRQQKGAAARFALAALHRISDGSGTAMSSSRNSLAETIADKIAADITTWISTTRDYNRTGVLEAMSEHYDVSLPLVVQAVRLLEDSGVLQLRRGRLGGIDLTAERTSAPAILAANAYFSTHFVSAADCDSLVRLINIALIERASHHHSGSLDTVDAALAAMRNAKDATTAGMQWFELQRALSNLADNAPLHLLVKCLAAYVVRVRTCKSNLTDTQARTLVDASQRIVANIRLGCARGSAEAHLECQEALGASW